MIGRVLDKYEILEEVGQGGMSVVYRGRDTSLGREVAVKVLHPHLAGHEEARQRFEREAQAVAKLRHENILAIFDYSGRDSAESYIVTEFIRGSTLKELTAVHPISHPEVAAMIVVEVCQALAHAHGLGVLHRDIKPENIMIREDGRVKLMDFGIAQIVDAQRLTVTGQLLGSPAYMAPEHVEGRPLDFRTDVFAAGVLLYQLATGELPFKGKNPHEVLKRISECRYIDARVVNPRVGEGLGRAIARALKREPSERTPDVGLLMDELLRYLAQGEITDVRAELVAFFANPALYEKELGPRLTSAMTRSGKAELLAKRAGVALELFNRVLTLDPSNPEVLREIDRLSRSRQLARVLAVAAGACGIAVLALLGGRLLSPGTPRAALAGDPPRGLSAADTSPVSEPVPPRSLAPRTSPIDAGPMEARRPGATTPPTGTALHTDIARPLRVTRPDAGVLPIRRIRLVPTPKNAEYSLDGQTFHPVEGGGAWLELGPGLHQLRLRHQVCLDEELPVPADKPDGSTLAVVMTFKPGKVRPVCAAATAIAVDDSPVESGTIVDVTGFGSQRSSRTVTVTFLVGDATQERRTTITAGAGPVEVRCD